MPPRPREEGTNNTPSKSDGFQVHSPAIALPKGGGAIRGIGEKFAANPVTGTGSLTVPIATSPGRSNFGPQLALAYDSGSGNGPFGFGWSLSLPAITRKTDKGLPKYQDAEESDVFMLSGAEDLVPHLVNNMGTWEPQSLDSPPSEPGYTIHRYHPRIEGLFARLERWTHTQTGISHWRTISKENITTLYGQREEARIADPNDAFRTRIFSWLICESYDDKGNAILYEYKAEDASQVDRARPEEQYRLSSNQFAQRYLKRIKYGNRTPRVPGEELTRRTDWLFEVVFDYGEHDLTQPQVSDDPQSSNSQLWPRRDDPFSVYRAGFEIRTYRLCRRILMFHHFPDELDGVVDYLVRSTDFTYTPSPLATFMNAATQSGYVRHNNTYLKQSLPKLEFRYTEAHVDATVHSMDAASIENVPYGVDGTHYQWVDLDSEGLSGVLTEQADAWLYKRNLGNGSLGPVEVVATRPSLAALNDGQQQLMDVAGNGRLDLVQFAAPLAGFYARTQAGSWDTFTPFQALPNLAWQDPNLRFVDLTGDGHADILITEDVVFTWYPSLAEAGFGPAERMAQAWDEDKGPQLVFADATQSVYLADMSGDGLTDLVRLRNGEVCYWPNLGYGRFGAKVTMSNAPLFDYPDLFDQKRIRVADIDGSGTTDIIYLGQPDIRLYFNHAGNGWSAPQRLTSFPKIDHLTSVTAVDLLGNGTACLVWSSPLPGEARQPMRYIDLMGGQKPHLLTSMTNNMGVETDVHYAASTSFYLQDRMAGHPWVTRLPFPVHVVERIESRDLVSNTRLVSTYRYRHGYFDGVEREFRGFAYVEQRDAETVRGQFDLPPIVTKTWFHTGAFLEGDHLEAYFKDPRNDEYFAGDHQAVFLPDTVLPPNLTADAVREAYRALKGSILRQEIYTEDGTAKAALPYSVSERSYNLRLLQPREPNQHAVFFSHARETLDYHYERSSLPDPTDPEPDPKKRHQLFDPRISHALTLEVDNFGNVTQSATVGCRGNADLQPGEQIRQTQTLITYTENLVINKPDEDNWYRIGVPRETRTYELTRVKPAATVFTVEELHTAVQQAELIPYETTGDGSPQKRPIEHVRTLYRQNDLSGLLPPGGLESMALPGESYKLALTPGLLDVFQTKASRTDLTTILTGAEGRYRVDGNGALWVPSGLIFYSPKVNPPDQPQEEGDFARNHFFLPHRFQDPFGHNAVVTYDEKYKLLIASTRDAVGNEVHVDNDYRVLQPRLLTDPNGNRTEARFDALSMVVGTTIMGKATGPAEGDSFATFTTDLTPPDITAFFAASNPRPLAISHLGTATTRIIYDLEQIPVCAASIARETHVNDLTPGEPTKVQLRFVYSDGFGREAQTKVQAEPGPLDPNDPHATVLDPRWVGTGAKVYNNKGKPVRQYQPFFSPTHHFGIEQHGVSSTLFYDPLERVVATLHPNYTYEKVVFDPWQQATWDVNDTLKLNPKTDPDVSGFFTRLPDADYLPTWYDRMRVSANTDEKNAAQRTEPHAETPTIAHFDTLGRTFLTIADNGKDANGNTQKYRTRIVFDIEGNQREVIDARDRIVMHYDYDMLGNRIHQASMEAGERWMLNDVTGKPIRAWDSRGHEFKTEYDELRRPVRQVVRGIDANYSDPRTLNGDVLFEKIEYGEGQTTDVELNLRTRVFKSYDSAGAVTSEAYDFKGNLLHSSRALADDYQKLYDWQTDTVQPTWETFPSSTTYDALNRPTAMTTPDNSVYRPTYNEANLLDKVEVNLRGTLDNTQQPVWTPFVTNIDYNAKGQRTLIAYGNNVQTAYTYDPQTFRLIHLFTDRGAGFPYDCPDLPPQGWPGCGIQNLHYTYDPAGNITHIRDDAQQTIFFRNQRVEPSADYRYDAIYRLINAIGREHLGQVGGAPAPTSPTDTPRIGRDHPNNEQAMGRYEEEYLYDEVGNILSQRHRGTDPTHPGWKRCYQYALDSNRLLSTGSPSDPNNPDSACPVHYAAGPVYTEKYTYDAHGNMTSMPHVPRMAWNFEDQLRSVDLGGGGTAYYVYDAGGQRVRKVVEKNNGNLIEERIYLGGFEFFRQHNGNGIKLERETLHVMDDKQRIALVETKTITNPDDDSAEHLIRYQFGNHLGSVSLELDDKAIVISYEEYYPYGSTSYQAVNKDIKAAAKRYRYTGKERDEESGLYYHGARYYAPWLGRWASCDPAEMVDGLNRYAYTKNNPVRFLDENGTQADESELYPSESELYQLVPSGRISPPEETIPAPDLLDVVFENVEPNKRMPKTVQEAIQVNLSPGRLFVEPEFTPNTIENPEPPILFRQVNLSPGRLFVEPEFTPNTIENPEPPILFRLVPVDLSLQKGPHREVNTPLPQAGPGFVSYHPGEGAKRQFARVDVSEALKAVTAEWAKRHSGGPRLQIGDISMEGGGPMKPHKAHRLGLDIDVRPVRSDAMESPVKISDRIIHKHLLRKL